MIFRRSIVAELTSAASAVFTVLFSILFSVGLVRILGQAAGGRVDNQAEFLAALAAARREAEGSFGDRRVLVEKYLEKPRNIELQILAYHEQRKAGLGPRVVNE